MNRNQPSLLRALLQTGACCALLVAQAAAQDSFFRRTQLSDAVTVDEVPGSTQPHLERIEALLADKQWDEAIETLRRLMGEGGSKLIPLKDTGDARDDPQHEFGSQRYIPLSAWCQLRLARLATEAPEALELYRDQVDAVAKRFLDEGLARRNAAPLHQIVGEMLCSSVGDDALYALGEMALERGEHAVARAYWQRISPALVSARREVATDQDGKPLTTSGRPLWIEHRQYPKAEIESLIDADGATTRALLVYPDSNFKLADVRARLVLASILEGSQERAQFELNMLKQLHPEAAGRLSGKQVKYHDALTQLLEQSRAWPARRTPADWQTFGGNFSRNQTADAPPDIPGESVWSIDLGDRLQIDESSLVESIGPRIAEDPEGLLSVHPIVVGDLVLLCDLAPASGARDFPHWVTRVRAYDLRTGKPAWPKRRAESEASGEAMDDGVIQQSRPFAVQVSDRRRWGVPRLTLSSDGRYAFARIGSPVTLRPRDELPVEGRDSLVALDLTQQGKLLWAPIELEEAMALEGPPVADGSSLYIAVRASQAQPQAEVACFDLKTGQKRWQTWVCGAESPALGRSEEVTHNLLTLHDGVIYFNTNLGCVAALRASDGQTLWATRYRRANFDPLASGEPAMNFQRDLNPCIYWRGLLFVAPSDCRSLLCLEASSGQLLWSTPASDIVHLLGIGGGRLIASGQRLWWIDPYTGTVAARFPESRKAEPQGRGRGTLAGNNIYWPTETEIYVFDQATARQVRQPIQLTERGASGGNLVVASGHLLVTTADKVIAFGEPEN